MDIQKCGVSCVFGMTALLPAAALAAHRGWYVAVDAGQAKYGGVSGDAGQWPSLPPTVIPPPAQPGFETSVISALTSVSSSDRDFAYRFTGGYQFNRYFGVEGSYVDLGSAQAKGQGTFYSVETCPPGYVCGIFPIGLPSVYGSTAKLTVRGGLLASTASWPLSPQWSLFARLGGVYAHPTLETTSTPEVNDELPDFTVTQNTRRFSRTDWKPVYGVGVDFHRSITGPSGCGGIATPTSAIVLRPENSTSMYCRSAWYTL